MTDAPDMRAAAEAALPSGEWRHEPNGWLYATLNGDPNWCVGKAYHLNGSMEANAAHIVASQPRAVLERLDAHAAEVSALRDGIPSIAAGLFEAIRERDVARASSNYALNRIDELTDERDDLTAERDALRAALRTACDAMVAWDRMSYQARERTLEAVAGALK